MDYKETAVWYSNLIKPTWAPPSWLFGPVWSVLYLLIAISFGYVFYSVYKRNLKAEYATPFFLNLVFNLIFSPIQFGLRNNFLALVDIVLVLITLVWFMKKIYPKRKWVALINIPYLLWVSFATFLQFTITIINWGS